MKVDCQRWKYVKAVAVDIDENILGESNAVLVSCEVCTDGFYELLWNANTATLQKPSILKTIITQPATSLLGVLVNSMTFVVFGAAIYTLWRCIVRRRGYSKLQQLWA